MFVFQRGGGRDAFWIFFAAFIILLTPGKTAKSQAAAKVGSTVFGVILPAVVSLVLPDKVLVSLGLLIILAGIDVVIGCAIALAATYLLWPKDSETLETVPAAAT